MEGCGQGGCQLRPTKLDPTPDPCTKKTLDVIRIVSETVRTEVLDLLLDSAKF